ncbi:MAG: hypothetical protein V3T30_08995 [Thermodesulfobacteriota bacterium]
MFKRFGFLFVALVLFSPYGCASVHQGAETAGEAGGKVISVPNSVSEGAAKGIAGKPKSNPYNR